MGAGNFADIKVPGQIHMRFDDHALGRALSEVGEDDGNDEASTRGTEEQRDHEGFSCCVDDRSDEVDEAKEACDNRDDTEEDGNAG